jgi:hypothetical protein
VGLDHVRIGIFNGGAVRMFHVLREGILTRKGNGRSRKGECADRNFESVLHNYSLLMTFTPTRKYKIETILRVGLICNNSVAKTAKNGNFYGTL